MSDLPHRNGNFRFLLIDSFSLRAHMWQTRRQIYPHRNDNFTFLLIDSYFESSHVADQVTDLPPRKDNFIFLLINSYPLELRCGRSYTPGNGDFRFLLIDSYSESSHVADQVTDLTPQEMVILDSY